MKFGLVGAVALGATFCVAGGAWANHTRSARIEGLGAFRKAEMSGIALDGEGDVRPGPVAKTFTSDAGAQVWSIIRARDGAIYASTGSNGAVYRIDGDGAAHRVDTFEYEVFTVVEGKDGRIYASGAPNATITRIDRDGSTQTLFDTPEKIVWCLLADADGNLYAGTGDHGFLYKITPDGKGSVLYRSQDSHIVSLAWSRDGKLIAGTDGRGLLLRIDPRSGAGDVLYEVQSSEISKIVVAPSGDIYFASTGAAQPKDPKPDEKDGHDQTVTLGEDSGPGEDGPGPAGGSRIFVRELDGSVHTVWQSPEESIHALVLDSEGRLLVGTGDAAALYRVTPNGDGTLLWKPEVGQVLSLLVEGETILAGTGNPGKVFRLGPDTDHNAWIRPEPIDAGTSASWGRAIWNVLPGSGKWEFRTRCGQTERPDSTWAGWSPALSDPDGSRIPSSPARYLQVEARFVAEGDKDPSGLSRVWLSYSEPNMPPRLGRIRFSTDDGTGGGSGGHDSGSFTQDLGGGVRVQVQRSQPPPAAPGQDEPPPPWVRDVRSVTWDAQDPDSDTMNFNLGIRRVGEAKFRSLARDLTVNTYAIDTGKLPAGEYEIEVTAADSPSNASGEGLTDRKIGGPFRVDHMPPEIIGLRAERSKPLEITVEGLARDMVSPIVRLELSWDGKPWRPIIPESGFLDGREEPFKAVLPLDREDQGSWIAVRAIDAAGNEGVGRIWLEQ